LKWISNDSVAPRPFAPLANPLNVRLMKLKSLDDIYIVSDKLVPVTQEQLDSARAALGTEFPPGFDEFMLKFGKGDYAGYLRPYNPERIVSELSSNREAFATDYWTEGKLRLTDAERAALIPFADTIDSDMFAFLPKKPEQIFVLPRQSQELFKTGPTFIHLLNWAANSGELVEPFDLKYFQPWNENASLRLNNPARAYDVDEIESFFKTIGAPDYRVRGKKQQSIDFFIRKYGAHLSYLLMDDYQQFIVGFDSPCAAQFLSLLTRALAGKGFQIAEHNNLAVLPDFS
jgi:hypothetical protein